MFRASTGTNLPDASDIGWGAVYDGQVASWDWNDQVSFLSSNERKMLAILMALKAFSSLILGKNIQALTDNLSATPFVNHKGGPSPGFSKLAMAIWAEVIKIGVSIKCGI